MTFNSFQDSSHLYFVTASVVEWKHLFSTYEYAKIVLDSLEWLQQQNRILLFAFVLMPSHLHIIIKSKKDAIGETLQQFGSFTAHEILKRLREDNKKDLLQIFQQNKRDTRHQHSIWQDIQAKIFIQKISCGRKWNIFTKTLWQRTGYL
jgi:putative transposase